MWCPSRRNVTTCAEAYSKGTAWRGRNQMITPVIIDLSLFPLFAVFVSYVVARPFL
jgi:nitrate reductase NapE component